MLGISAEVVQAVLHSPLEMPVAVLLADWYGILIGVGICSTRAVARLEACGAALFPSLLVGSPSDLWSDPLLVFLVVVPPLGLWGGLSWALAHGPPSDLAVAPDLVLDLVPHLELRRREWQIYWQFSVERRPARWMVASRTCMGITGQLPLFSKNMVIYPSVWIIIHYSHYPQFLVKKNGVAT